MRKIRIVCAAAISAIAVTGWMAARWNAPPAGAIAQLDLLVRDPLLEQALARSNQANAQVTLAWVHKQDAAWRAGNSALAKTIAASQASRRIAALTRADADQIMLFDRRGLMVGALRLTHDYDQSDEAKWQGTIGSGNLHMLDEGSGPIGSDGAMARQLSRAVVDAATGAILGGVTVVWREDS